MLARGGRLPGDAERDAILDQRSLLGGPKLPVSYKILIRQYFGKKLIEGYPALSINLSFQRSAFIFAAKTQRKDFTIEGAEEQRVPLVPTPAWSFMKYRISTWTTFAALMLALAVLSPAAHAQSAKKLYKQGQAAEAKGDVETAYQRYLAAYQKDPKDEFYRTAYSRLRLPAAALHVSRGEKLRDQGDVTGAVTEFLRALQIDPSNELAQQEIQATRNKVDQAAAPPGLPPPPPPTQEQVRMRNIGAPIDLKPLSTEPLTLHTAEDSKTVYQTVGKLAGINVLFDPDYTSKRIQVDLANVDLYDALRIIGTVSQTFWRPITANTIFVAQDSRTTTGNFFIDEEVLAKAGITDFSGYAVSPGTPLKTDLFLD